MGRTIVDRYEVLSLINSGGMGAVYRARQRSLNRPVAIKFIHQHLLRSAQSIQRFMVEAQTLSRLHHPHVVSVLDFGRMPDDEGGNLFLVMELLGGRDLFDVLQVEPLLPIPYVVDIITQILEGLAEAHHADITHRDVKPENVILEPLRSGRHHVKLIDFGVAKFTDARKVTNARKTGDHGVACGTPAYMAPEQLLGTAGPSVDIFSVGVVLFQMLTGAMPAKNRPLHLPGGPRVVPDPRKIAPLRGISDALAEACMCALAREPEDRFPNTQAFVDAIREAMIAHPLTAWDRPSWPALINQTKPNSVPPPPADPVSDTVPADFIQLFGRRLSQPITVTRTDILAAPLVGRDADIDWATTLLRLEQPPAVVAFWGRMGVGRTRLLREVATLEKTDQNMVIFVTPEPAPYQEVGYRGLRQILRLLTGRTDEELANDNTTDQWSHLGLRMLFSKTAPNPQSILPQRAASAALAWGIWRASCRCLSGRVILAIDDADKLDGATFLALRDYLAGDPIAGFTALLASEHARPILSLNGVRERALRGLSAVDAAQMLSIPPSETFLSPFESDDIEPLYVERLALAINADAQIMPDTLQSLIEKQRSELSPDERQIIHVLQTLGLCTAERLDALLALDVAARKVLAQLVEKGWVEMQGDVARLMHASYGYGAQGVGPSTSTNVLHEVAARDLEGARDLIELRAFHAIQGIADFEAFLLIEESARLRAARGDKQGVITALTQAMSAARIEWTQGRTEAASTALEVFGRKLASALVSAGRMEQAQAVLDEILNTTEPKDIPRATLLEQCAQVSELRGRNDQAERLRREALKIADRLADRKLAKRLRAALLESSLQNSQMHEPESDDPPSSRFIQPETPQRSVLIVEDDPAIREALQSVLESEGHTAHTAANGREALALLRRIPHPQLILLDLMMPVMSGWELLGMLRADPELSGIPVVVVSAAPPKGELAASRVLKKPIEVNTLLRVIEELCE